MNGLRGIALLLLLAVWPLGQARAYKALEELKPFLRMHCLECHGPNKQKNEIRFDTLDTDLTDRRTLEIWQEALDQLNLGEMPPKKAAQPERGGRVLSRHGASVPEPARGDQLGGGCCGRRWGAAPPARAAVV